MPIDLLQIVRFEQDHHCRATHFPPPRPLTPMHPHPTPPPVPPQLYEIAARAREGIHDYMRPILLRRWMLPPLSTLQQSVNSIKKSNNSSNKSYWLNRRLNATPTPTPTPLHPPPSTHHTTQVKISAHISHHSLINALRRLPILVSTNEHDRHCFPMRK